VKSDRLLGEVFVARESEVEGVGRQSFADEVPQAGGEKCSLVMTIRP